MQRKIAAWFVHIFTASGAVLALLALMAVQDHRWTDAMLWLFAALVVDGIDGTLARAAHTKAFASRIDGEVLDLVIDYLNYVFVPTIFILETQALPQSLAIPLAAMIQISSLYVFARKDMKTEDGYFRGFPALWNIVALYLYAAEIGPAPSAAIVVLLILLTFAPVHVAHPFRVRDYGYWLSVIAITWAGSTLALLLPLNQDWSRQAAFWTSAVSAVCLILPGLFRTFKGARRSPASPLNLYD